MSYGSYTTTHLSTAKLEISLLLKPSASVPPAKRPLEDFNEGSANGTLGIPVVSRTGSGSIPTGRRPSESSISSAATTPSLATATTSRQPSLPAITTPDPGRASMEISSAPRPILPPLRSSPPMLHQPMFMQHASPPNYLTQRSHSSYSTPSYQPAKRQRTSSPPPAITQPAKRQSKWTPDEDAVIIELRGSGMKWEDISKKLPGRSAISCRLHYQNYLERRSEWDEEKKNRLARLYERLKPEMWGGLAAELGIPWRAAEAMHWQLGETGMASRAGVTPFSMSSAQAQSRQPSYTAPASLHPPGHQRGHSDPPFDSAHHHPHHQQHHTQQSYPQQSQPRYIQSHSDPRAYQPGPPPPLPPQPHQMVEKPELIRLTRPPSPVLNMSPGEQSRRVLPSMAELDQGLTAAAMADAHRSGAVSSSSSTPNMTTRS